MKKNNLATMEDFAKLNALIEQEDVKGIKTFFADIIRTRYGAGHQEQHLRSLAALMDKYEKGLWAKTAKKQWAINKMVTFYGNVAGQTLY
jgi:hypothetical protein